VAHGAGEVDGLTFTECMEQLQEGYVASVAAAAGCLYNRLMHDSYGFDTLLVKKRSPDEEELSVYVQLKCTTTVKPDPSAEFFSFQLKKREYFQRLAVKRSHPKALLLVMATCPSQRDWAKGDHESLSVSHCCYWLSLEGKEVPGAASPTVHVPTGNIFDADALLAIFDVIDKGGDLSAVTGTR
jgi:hypothetical protein